MRFIVLIVLCFHFILAAVNINTANQKELMTLNGIGEVKAKAIIEYRNKTKFKKIDDIKNVKGIGESTFENIKKDITVGNINANVKK